MDATQAAPAKGAGPVDRTAQRHTYVDFFYYKLDPGLRRLPAAERSAAADELAAFLSNHGCKLDLRVYHTVGLRHDCDFLLWAITKDLEEASKFQSAFQRTAVGRWSTPAYTYVAVTKPTAYAKSHPQNFEIGPSPSKYLFVYPFIKSHAWYLLPFEERKKMMDVHQKVGAEFPMVRLNTTYSFGLGDQDFVLAFECDEPKDFSDLVQRLRETEARKYTVSDVPLLPCIQTDAAGLVQALALR